MSYSELIHSYLDGQLDQVSQDSLFGKLASDQDLRREFNQQMKLHIIAQNDMATISPPIESTNAIFTALGFSIPSRGSAPLPVIKTPFSEKAATALRKYLPYAATTIIATVLTALIFFYLFDKYFSRRDDLSASGNNAIPYVASVEKSKSAPEVQPVSPSLTKEEMSRLFTRAVKESFDNMFRQNAAYYAPQVQQNNVASGSFAENSVPQITRSKMNVNSFDNTSAFLIRGNADERNIYLNNDRYETVMNSSSADERDGRIALELRNITSKSDPNLNLAQGAKPWFNNLSASLMYEFSKNHSLGFSVGQEQFGQEFTRFADNIVYSYKQNPTLFWYGLQYKLTLPDLIYSNVIYPYATVLVGGTTVGPTGRLQIGLQYQPDKRVTFMLGGEASMLYYNVQNNIFRTNKYGITYGIGIHY